MTLTGWIPDAPTERGTNYDGVLSYAVEWHALIIGISVGVLARILEAINQRGAAYSLIGGLISLALGVEVWARELGIKVPFLRSPKYRNQIRREPHYALAGLAMGFYAPQEAFEQIRTVF